MGSLLILSLLIFFNFQLFQMPWCDFLKCFSLLANTRLKCFFAAILLKSTKIFRSTSKPLCCPTTPKWSFREIDSNSECKSVPERSEEWWELKCVLPKLWVIKRKNVKAVSSPFIYFCFNFEALCIYKELTEFWNVSLILSLVWQNIQLSCFSLL